MPSPFNNPVEPVVEKTTGSADTIAILNSVLTCQFCYNDSSEGTYHPDVKILVWDCDTCDETNIVKGFEL